MESSSLVKRAFLGIGGRRYLADSACTIFATRREMEKAEAVFGDLRGEVVHWPVEAPPHSLSAEQRRALRRGWDVPEDARVLLCFGRLHPMKRPLETIRAAAAAREPNFYLVIIGPEEGVTRADCEAEARRAGFHNLRVLGPVYGERKLDCLMACDAYISLSHRENFNHCAAESMTAGLPVLLSQGNDLGPEVADARAGWHLAEDTPAAWRTAVEEVCACTPGQLAEMGRRGRQFVADTFSFAHFRARLRGLAARHGRQG